MVHLSCRGLQFRRDRPLSVIGAMGGAPSLEHRLHKDLEQVFASWTRFLIKLVIYCCYFSILGDI